MALIEEHKNNISQIAAGLQSFEFEGPRGTVYFDTKTNTSLASLYHAAIVPDNEGKCEVKIEGMADDISGHFKKIAAYELDNATSSWYNSYTCI